ncbi:MAG: GAF domain-containing sensor histidine kinase [Anaerolineales bacterium]|nr:GAF domain-containing sensor histidine kinase [Anaerolineales bacterium]
MAKNKPEQLERLVEISLTLNSSLDVDQILDFILSTGVDLLECEGISIMLYDEEDGQLYFTAATDTNIIKLGNIPIPLEGSIAGTIFRENAPLLINDIENDPRHYRAISERTNYTVRNLLGAPLHIREHTIGVIEATNKKQGVFDQQDVQLLSYIAAQAAIAIRNAQIVKQLQLANEELRQADKLKADFMAVASHELRTPLGIVLGYATFLKEESVGELAEHADTMLSAAMRLRALLEDMTSMNLLYTGETQLRMELTALQTFIEQAYALETQVADEKDIRVTFHFPEETIWVQADERLQKVFQNLLNNAIRFTPSPGEVDVYIHSENNDVLIEFKDSGIGIPQDQLEPIFEHFYQVEHHMTRRYGGLGLGLSIARGLVELHGGRMWAESDGPNQGATFKVVLPCAFS